MNSVLQNHFTGNKAGEINKNLFWCFYWNSVILFAFLRLCIKPGIQKRGTECGNVGNGGYIPGNVVKHSRECTRTFREMLPNIPGNVLKHSVECHQAFWGMLPNIPGNVPKHSGKFLQTLGEISANVPRNVLRHFGNVSKHSGDCRQTLPDPSRIDFSFWKTSSVISWSIETYG